MAEKNSNVSVLSQPVRILKGVGESKAKGLGELGVFTVGDMLWYFPRRYEDRQVVPLEEVELYGTYAVRLKVSSKISAMNAKGLPMVRFSAIEVKLDESGMPADNPESRVDIVYFHSEYVKNIFKQGNIYVFYGKITGNLVKFEMANPKFIPYQRGVENSRFYPIYKKNSKVSHNTIIKAAQSALDLISNSAELSAELETLPEQIRDGYNLCHINFALGSMHRPQSQGDLEAAKKRLVFEEFFLYSLALEQIKSRREYIPGYKYQKEADMDGFYSLLPFRLTNAQQRAVDDVISDMGKDKPMSRLIQGDVGSGKTMIAAAAAYFACKNDSQAVMMAPTDILATQHYEGLSRLFEKTGIRVRLLTGSLNARQKRETLREIEDGAADFIIGTHAVIQKNIVFKNLSLSITDEQHRFGVNQRALIEGKAEKGKGNIPHSLVMSATPIPRTLALIMYGDLDVSVINELPPGRQKVETYAVDDSFRERIYKFTKKLIGEGGQAFIVCPLVGEDEGEEKDEDMEIREIGSYNMSDMKSVKSYFKELSENIFPEIPSAFIHGKMKSEEKDGIMGRFKDGEIKILVSTVVIEVGVNIPGAVLMIIENAERFGLSQLHQLRGRVGRGEKKSYCVMFCDNENENSKKRLDIMCKTNDGFEIAKKDIEIRGPGDLFGERQSGSVTFKVADLAADTEILYSAAKAAKEAIANIKDLFGENGGHTRLKQAVLKMFGENEQRKIAFN
ncbi:MAG: ATP-dependent DNA helicase RecG [Oscillospiraceae bacterium]|nr:ATP-dependent DNA helicase RecG [Oscillospiraceae bacterium]